MLLSGCVQKKFMPDTPEIHTLLDKLIAPLKSLILSSPKRRNCPVLEDEDWIKAGLLRVLSNEISSRGFLQQLADQLQTIIARSSFFKTLRSARRLAFCQHLNEAFAQGYKSPKSDRLSDFASLAKYDIYAGDGHYRAAATHDKRTGDKKYAVGHFYALNLRNDMLTHLDSMVEEPGRKKEHDMHLLKRMSIQQLRQGAAKGRKVLYVWDKAGIDFSQWFKWKQGSGIYFLSLEKKNMKLRPMGPCGFDLNSSINAGVVADQLVGTDSGVMMRRVRYQCPDSGKVFHFVSSVMDVDPGLIAHLYKMRWKIEKTFDELKTKLTEKKAWASSTVARNTQANFTCLAHNLMVVLEEELAEDDEVYDNGELIRRKNRYKQLTQRVKSKGKQLPLAQQAVPRATQRTQKFIRWLRNHCWIQAPWWQAQNALKRIYATS